VERVTGDLRKDFPGRRVSRYRMSGSSAGFSWHGRQRLENSQITLMACAGGARRAGPSKVERSWGKPPDVSSHCLVFEKERAPKPNRGRRRYIYSD
jgi:hypothetical protein